jgi:hypothetical protein
VLERVGSSARGEVFFLRDDVRSCEDDVSSLFRGQLSVLLGGYLSIRISP